MNNVATLWTSYKEHILLSKITKLTNWGCNKTKRTFKNQSVLPSCSVLNSLCHRRGKKSSFLSSSLQQPTSVSPASIFYLQNCMLGVDKDQVWMGSEDSVIYIINMVAMVCNRQLTEHRAEVTGLALDADKYRWWTCINTTSHTTTIEIEYH